MTTILLERAAGNELPEGGQPVIADFDTMETIRLALERADHFRGALSPPSD